MRFRMDPRAKLYLLLLANLMLFFHVGTGAEAVATGLFLLLFFLSGHTRTGIRLSVVYFGLLAIDLFVVPLAGEGILLNLLSLVSVGIRMMLPCIITGAYAFSTTTIGELTAALRRMHVPESRAPLWCGSSLPYRRTTTRFTTPWPCAASLRARGLCCCTRCSHWNTSSCRC